MDSPHKQIKKFGGVVVVAMLLVAFGVVAVNNMESPQIVSLENAQAMAQVKDAQTALSNLPDESAVETPRGWKIESDEPVEGSGSEEELVGEDAEDDLEQESLAEDEDIDSPFQVEEDANGQEFVADLDSDVIVDATENNQEQGKQVIAADGHGAKRCYKNLKRCGAKRSCTRKCTKKCRPYAIRRCKQKKFCRCFCKFQKNYRLARKCVVYKKKTCKKGLQWRCKRDCRKFCKKIPHCYCCPRSHIRQRCRKFCRRYTYKSKCVRCRCLKVRCYKTCRFLCIKKYK